MSATPWERSQEGVHDEDSPMGLAAVVVSTSAGRGHEFPCAPRRVSGHKLYALAEGGTLLFAEGDGALRPDAFASRGLGVDNAR